MNDTLDTDGDISDIQRYRIYKRYGTDSESDDEDFRIFRSRMSGSSFDDSTDSSDREITRIKLPRDERKVDICDNGSSVKLVDSRVESISHLRDIDELTAACSSLTLNDFSVTSTAKPDKESDGNLTTASVDSSLCKNDCTQVQQKLLVFMEVYKSMRQKLTGCASEHVVGICNNLMVKQNCSKLAFEYSSNISPDSKLIEGRLVADNVVVAKGIEKSENTCRKLVYDNFLENVVISGLKVTYNSKDNMSELTADVNQLQISENSQQSSKDNNSKSVETVVSPNACSHSKYAATCLSDSSVSTTRSNNQTLSTAADSTKTSIIDKLKIFQDVVKSMSAEMKGCDPEFVIKTCYEIMNGNNSCIIEFKYRSQIVYRGVFYSLVADDVVVSTGVASAKQLCERQAYSEFLETLSKPNFSIAWDDKKGVKYLTSDDASGATSQNDVMKVAHTSNATSNNNKTIADQSNTTSNNSKTSESEIVKVAHTSNTTSNNSNKSNVDQSNTTSNNSNKSNVDQSNTTSNNSNKSNVDQSNTTCNNSKSNVNQSNTICNNSKVTADQSSSQLYESKISCEKFGIQTDKGSQLNPCEDVNNNNNKVTGVVKPCVINSPQFAPRMTAKDFFDKPQITKPKTKAIACNRSEISNIKEEPCVLSADDQADLFRLAELLLKQKKAFPSRKPKVLLTTACQLLDMKCSIHINQLKGGVFRTLIDFKSWLLGCGRSLDKDESERAAYDDVDRNLLKFHVSYKSKDHTSEIKMSESEVLSSNNTKLSNNEIKFCKAGADSKQWNPLLQLTSYAQSAFYLMAEDFVKQRKIQPNSVIKEVIEQVSKNARIMLVNSSNKLIDGRYECTIKLEDLVIGYGCNILRHTAITNAYQMFAARLLELYNLNKKADTQQVGASVAENKSRTNDEKICSSGNEIKREIYTIVRKNNNPYILFNQFEVRPFCDIKPVVTEQVNANATNYVAMKEKMVTFSAVYKRTVGLKVEKHLARNIASYAEITLNQAASYLNVSLSLKHVFGKEGKVTSNVLIDNCINAGSLLGKVADRSAFLVLSRKLLENKLDIVTIEGGSGYNLITPGDIVNSKPSFEPMNLIHASKDAKDVNLGGLGDRSFVVVPPSLNELLSCVVVQRIENERDACSVLDRSIKLCRLKSRNVVTPMTNNKCKIEYWLEDEMLESVVCEKGTDISTRLAQTVLNKLTKLCPTVIAKRHVQCPKYLMYDYNRIIGIGNIEESLVTPLDDQCLGYQKLRGLGWDGKLGLGRKGREGRVYPITVDLRSRSNLAGFGCSIENDYIGSSHFFPILEGMIFDHLTAQNREDLIFGPLRSFDKRAITKFMAILLRYGLGGRAWRYGYREAGGGRGGECVRVEGVRSPCQLALHIRENGGNNHLYQLVEPGM